jgi:hypothetical protein
MFGKEKIEKTLISSTGEYTISVFPWGITINMQDRKDGLSIHNLVVVDLPVGSSFTNGGIKKLIQKGLSESSDFFRVAKKIFMPRPGQKVKTEIQKTLQLEY